MKKFFRLSIILLLLIFLASCGSKKSPTGGPEDLERPVIVTSFPPQFSNISEGRIEINFSKPLDKTTIPHSIYIYPPVMNKKITVDKNSIIIQINEKLLPDTNYYVIISTRLKDIRGNSPEHNQTLVYTSGKLNQLRLSGTIGYENPKDNSLPVQMSLLSADSLLVLSQVSQGSSYAIEPLNPAYYILRAYIDKNVNGRYDFTQEPFFEQPVMMEHSNNLDLFLAYADTTSPTIKLITANHNREVEITFSEAIKGYSSIKINRLDNKEELPVLLSYLEEDKLTLLTPAQEAFAYTVEISDVKDRKGNTNQVIKSEFRSSSNLDTEPPQVLSSSPRNGTSVKTLEPVLVVCFSEVIPKSSIKASLKATETKAEIPIDILESDSRIYRFKPQRTLQNYRSYVLTISATDISGNSMPESFNLNFLPLLYQE
ncbi:MAG: Ig-like domain-containing protein [Candidatus Cloacimonadaceae bacterium]|jgi:hypothetical protein|nr:Ig-like domain-containing protein [Candidatus Cloacimonadota bacterium]MCB5258589.1 Ig-like domain-containing protein [Candidatus Cloacimonadota bacterium]MDD5625286.1 Ig-like domain-containing protein [Candidatus Cloacimonadota bacterium]MDY0111948.1 Ig-like domain-containing protein [Candidatus Syntrophosphaera sp.]